MATQHPDNASRPYWNSKAFVSTAAELRECQFCFSSLGIDEYNWDWEGKFVDEAVADRLLHKYLDYFRENPLGKEKFLTFRIPNPRVEKQFRLARAFMVIITSSQMARSLDFSQPPIFECILPLTENAAEIFELQKAFQELVSLEHRLLSMGDSLQSIEIIPLFEQVSTIMNADSILREYLELYHREYKKKPAYLRPYFARSDPALNSGLVATMLAIKIGLGKLQALADMTGVPMFPMLGTGSLPFRGGLSPETIDYALHEYAGIRTFTVQSAFRYDYPRTSVKQAIKTLSEKLQSTKAPDISEKDITALQTIIPHFETAYRGSIERIAQVINDISIQVPRRRERVQHIGLFGYNRGIGSVSLPRAIPFTASLYSIGVPPEFIGTGRGIAEAVKMGLWETGELWYSHLRDDLIRAGHFLSKSNLDKLAARDSAWQDIIRDISEIEHHFRIELGPETEDQKEHVRLSEKILKDLDEKKIITNLITQTGVLRKSLG